MNTNRLIVPVYRQINDIDQISCLTGSGNYTLKHVTNQANPLMVSLSLTNFEDQPNHVVRISQSALINPTHLDLVVRIGDKSLSLLLRNGLLVTPSRRRTASTLARLLS